MDAIEKGIMSALAVVIIVNIVQYAVTGTDAGSTLFRTLGPIMTGIGATIAIALGFIKFALKN